METIKQTLETSQVVNYLINKNPIAAYGLGGTIHLTHWGVKEMEQALDNPERPSGKNAIFYYQITA